MPRYPAYTPGGPGYYPNSDLPTLGPRIWPNGNGPEPGVPLTPLNKYAFGQAQASIRIIGYGSGQCQADIKQTGYGSGQCQADIKSVGYGSGQCQATIRGNAFGQAQGDIKATGYGSGQCQALLGGFHAQSGQCQADIRQTYWSFAQCQADILATSYQFAQAQATIQGNAFGQAQADIKTTNRFHAQAQADIKRTNRFHAQALATIRGNKFGQAQADIKATSTKSAQANAFVLPPGQRVAQAQALIFIFSGTQQVAQANAQIQPIDYYLFDSFNRVETQGNLGSPDIGPAWSHAGDPGSFNDVQVNGQELWLNSALSSFLSVEAVSAINVRNSISYVEFKSNDPTNFYIEIDTRENVSPLHYTGAWVALDGTWFLYDSAGGTQDTFSYPLTAGVYYSIRLKAFYSQVQFKIWPTGTPEPSNYQLSITTTVLNSGSFYLYMDTETQNTADAFINVINVTPVQIQKSAQAQATILVLGNASAQAQAIVNQAMQTGQANALIESATKQQFGQAQAFLPLASQFGQTQAFIASIIVLDTFSRTEDANTLGTPDIGPAYNEDIDVAVFSAITDISGENLKIFFEDISVQGVVFGQVPTYAKDQISSIEFTTDTIDSSISRYHEIVGLYRDNGDQYVGVYLFSGGVGNQATFNVEFNFDNDFQDDDTPYNLVLEPNVTYVMKYKYQDDTVWGKIWKKLEAEPDWQVTVTHSSGTPPNGGSNYFFFGGFTEPTAHQVTLDNYMVVDFEPPFPGGHAQALASIKRTFRSHAQAQGTIIRFMKHGQAQAKINAFGFNRFAQAQGKIAKGALYGQALADIKRVNRSHGLARAQINQSKQTGQTQADIRQTYTQYAQARAKIIKGISTGQAQADIKNQDHNSGQALAYIHGPYLWANAQALIRKYPFSFAQAQASIQVIFVSSGQAMGTITKPYASAQCQAYIVSGTHSGQAQADIRIKGFNFGQCQALIRRNQGYGQAQAVIKHSNSGQAQALIRASKFMHGLALGLIINTTIATTQRNFAQAQGYIKKTIKSGQAQGVIKKSGINSGQANAAIVRGSHSAQAQALIDGKRYLVSYNGKQLPGYAQSEALDSIVSIQDAYSGFRDGSLSEYYGLQNKIVSLTLKTVGTDLADNKDQIQEATTILRSKRDGFAKFYVQRYDRYYLAIARDITAENDVRTNKTAQYAISLETKPWLLGEQTYTISGTGLVQTIGRTTANGGWSPVRVRMTGQDITVSGYTATNSFTGFISVSGIVTDLMVNSEAYSATIGGVNKNNLMNNVDYALFVGPETTYFDINGATECVIEWEDRWYL